MLAVAFLDVVAYSVMVESDAEWTLEHWAALRDTVIEPLALSRGGRIVERHGDGLLLEFNSAVAALTWALAVQSHIRATLPDLHGEPPPLLVRIAIHLGEVIDDGKSYSATP